MQVSGPALGPSCEWRRAILCGVVFLCISGIPVRGQDVADAARQEKVRKADEPKSPKHVYTEDDLKRTVILTPDDQARVEARKLQQNGVRAELNAEQHLDDGVPLTESLGEIARRYRQGKAARDAELAAKKNFTSFPYELRDAALAAPKPSVGPLSATKPGSKENSRRMVPGRPSGPSVPLMSSSRTRISPFQPRHFHDATLVPQPAVPVVPPEPVRPPSATPHGARAAVADPTHSGMRRIVVEKGQSWWKLSELYLGSGSRWFELRELNANAGGPRELLQLGSAVVVPETAKPTESLVPGSIRVRKGDSLWSLARQYLGRGSAWGCLASANPLIVDFSHLAVGSSVRLPEGDALRSCRNGTVEKTQK